MEDEPYLTLPGGAFESVNSLRDELAGASDRAAAIVGCALLDDELKILLDSIFIKHKLTEDIFEGTQGLLGAFAARIKIAVSVGAISATTARDLHKLKRIRNYFAHVHERLTLADPSIVDSLRALSVVRDSHLERDRKYSGRDLWQYAVLSLFADIQGRRIAAKPFTPPEARTFVPGEVEPIKRALGPLLVTFFLSRELDNEPLPDALLAQFRDAFHKAASQGGFEGYIYQDIQDFLEESRPTYAGCGRLAYALAVLVNAR